MTSAAVDAMHYSVDFGNVSGTYGDPVTGFEFNPKLQDTEVKIIFSGVYREVLGVGGVTNAGGSIKVTLSVIVSNDIEDRPADLKPGESGPIGDKP